MIPTTLLPLWRLRLPALALLAVHALGCAPATPPPVTEPVETAGMDPFILEFIAPHVAAAKAAPLDPELRGTLGLVYEANKMWFLARSAFRHASELDPKKPEWQFHAANLALIQGDSAEAEVLITGLCRRVPTFAPARAARAGMLFDQGELERALIEYRATTQLEPKWVESRVAEAEILVQLERAEEALPILERAAKMNSSYKRIHYVRGLALRDLGRNEEADRELALGLDAKRVTMVDRVSGRRESYLAGQEAQNQKAVGFIQDGRHAKAIEILEAVLRRMPGDAATSNNLSVAYRSTGQQQKAATLLEASATKNPKHFPTLINLSGCYWELKDFERALSVADRAIELVPENGRARVSKARALISLERHEEARVELETSLRFDSSQLHVFVLMGQTQMQLSRFEQAERTWLTLLEKAPGDYATLLSLVRCQARLGKTKEAEESFAKLKAIAPNDQAVKTLGNELGL